MSNDAIWTVRTTSRRTFEVVALSKKEAEKIAVERLMKNEKIMYVQYKGEVK